MTEGDPVRFNIGQLEGPFRIGYPFSIPLEFTDEKRHPTKPVKELKPDISAEGLDITYDEVYLTWNRTCHHGLMVIAAGGHRFMQSATGCIIGNYISFQFHFTSLRQWPGQ